MAAASLPSDVARTEPKPRSAWLFSRPVDLAVFAGSFLVAMLALAIGAWAGVLDDETPGWAWVPAVVLCDVAHVWSTMFRTYLDPEERRARKRLFVAVPVLGILAMIALRSVGHLAFWRALAYLAIFHFVRQQYGWVALYRARAGERDRLGRIVDTAAIYAATLYPLLYWHAHVPRRFSWFVAGDVVSLPPAVLPVAFVVYVCALGAYVARAVVLAARGRTNSGKHVVVVTTALAWYVGIVYFDSDYAFTVTNVVMHGVPYFALVYVHTRRRSAEEAPARPRALATSLTRNVLVYLAALWLVAFGEELLWDRAIWHERAWLFGSSWELGEAAQIVLVPLLALPQLTHYVLDGFIWRRRSNASVAALVDAPGAAASGARSAATLAAAATLR